MINTITNVGEFDPIRFDQDIMYQPTMVVPVVNEMGETVYYYQIPQEMNPNVKNEFTNSEDLFHDATSLIEYEQMFTHKEEFEEVPPTTYAINNFGINTIANEQVESQEGSKDDYLELSRLVSQIKPMTTNNGPFFPTIAVDSIKFENYAPQLYIDTQTNDFVYAKDRNCVYRNLLLSCDEFRRMSKQDQDEYLMSLIQEQRQPNGKDKHNTIWCPPRDAICKILKTGTGRLNRLAQKKYEETCNQL
jgi:hypothetical protein